MIQIKNTIKSLLSGTVFSFRLLWENERKLYVYLLLSASLGTVNAFLLILFPKCLLDNVTERKYTTALLIIGLFATIQLAFSVFNGWLNKNKEISVEKNRLLLKILLAEKLATLRQEQLEDPEKSRQYEVAKKSIDKGNVEACVEAFLSLVSSVVVISGVIYILKLLPFWFMLLICIVMIVNAIGHIVRAKYTYKEMTEETPTERELYYLRGRLMNREYAKEIRAFHLENFIVDKTQQTIDKFFFISQRYNVKHNRILWWTDMMNGLQTVAFSTYNVFLFFQQIITVGTFTMNMSALFQFSDSLNTIFTKLVAMAEQSVYLKDYREFIFMPSSYQGQIEISVQEMYTIEFVDVSFRYPGQEQNALEHISLTIHQGEKVSIVGANGAGKSTFTKLLLGLYRPTSGSIFLNGTNIEELDSGSYLRLFSAVMQDYQLFSFTILENIIFSEDPSPTQLAAAWECVREIGLSGTIERLHNGMGTFLTQRYNEKGIDLSGGEHQKLAIARALYHNSPIMILDEPTSALSPQSEYDIYQRFSKMTNNKTVLYISHRLSSCTLCDRILVFDEGRIVEDGSHWQLLEQGGQYAKMFHKQASLYGF